MDVLSLAKKINAARPGRDWDQQCQRLVWNVLQQIHGYTDAQGDRMLTTYPTARAAREASKIESTNAAAAPAGAMHYWRNPTVEGHVGVALGNGRVLMTGTKEALGSEGKLLGNNFGITTVDAYTKARGNPYLGWSRRNGANTTIVGRISDEPQKKPVSKKPAPVDLKSIVKSKDFENVDDLFRAASATKLPLFLAVALIEKESKGRNIFGHDRGGAFHGAGEVTEKKFKDFLKLVRSGHTSNGVGPAQITWPGFFDDAEKRGFKLWEPYDNMRYGFELFRSYLGGNYTDASIAKAGERYNGASAYGRDMVAVANKWSQALGENKDSNGTVGFVRASGLPGAPMWPVGSMMARVQRALKARGRYSGPADGVGGPMTARGIQTTLNHSRQNGVRRDQFVQTDVDGILGRNNAYGIQYYAQKHGDYTGPIDGDPRENSWASFALGLERP